MAVLALVVLAAGAAPPGKRVFVNETADHKHDRALRSSARWFQEATGIALGMVLLPRLPGDARIEEHADTLFQRLGLGRKTDGKALLFLWAERERQFKIEVSYDLEDVFPDALCKRLEEGARTFMLSSSPFARRDFLVELAVTMKLRYLEYRKSGRAPDMATPDAGTRYVGNYLSGGAGIVGRNYAATLQRIEEELLPLPGALVDEMQPAPTPEEAIRRYLRLLELGIGSPNVPLLTEASRYFRMDKPHAPGYLRRIRAYIAESGGYEVRVQGDLAAATFRKGAPVLPIFLRRDEAGLWRVDEPKVWASLHLFQDGSSRLKYADSPYAFAAAPPPGERAWSLFERRASPPPLLPMPTKLRERLAAAEARVQAAPGDVEGWIALADLLHFEIFWLQASEAVYERIVALAPGRIDMRWRHLDILEMTSDTDGQNRTWCVLLQRSPNDDFIRWHYRHFRASFYAEDPGTDRCRNRFGIPFG